MLAPWQNPSPTTFTLDDTAVLIDPFSIEYAVDDAAGAEYIAWTAATRLALGYYEATSYANGAGAAGRRTIRWRMKVESTSSYRSWSQGWETYRRVQPAPVYAMISDLRDEAITESVLSNTRAELVLFQASRQIDRFTGRTFGASFKTFLADARGGPLLMLEEPVISVTECVLGAESLTSTEQSLDPDGYRVYNRHVLGLMVPDDRENPKLEFRFYGSRSYGERRTLAMCDRTIFVEGQQNVRLSGVFGYTELDGSPAGGVPKLITLACVLLAARLATKAGDPGSGVVDPNAWRVIEERTRDQTVKYASPSGGSAAGLGRGNAMQGAFTGDPNIDTILAMFCRPPSMSAA